MGPIVDDLLAFTARKHSFKSTFAQVTLELMDHASFFFFLSIFQCGPFVVVMGHGEDICLPRGPC